MRGQEVASSESSYPKTLFRALRIHQWIKNILLFVPVLTSHRVGDQGILFDSLVAFVCFGLCASAGYLWNDLRDIEHDRTHPTKRFRPIASGEMSVRSAGIWIFFLLSVGLLMGWMVGHGFALVLAIYFLTSFLYSAFWKRAVLWDVVVLAMLYTIRIVGGHVATGIAPSDWLFAFALFIFFSLASVKRYVELRRLASKAQGSASGRGYQVEELPVLLALGCGSACVSTLVLALYVNSPQVLKLYQTPAFLWFICPLNLYWTGRVWVLAHRGRVDEDPIVFALRDRVSYLVGAAVVVVMILATKV